MKILIISLAGIGDTLIATPLIHELKANFPAATIDAFVFWPGASDLLAGNPHLSTIHQKNLVREGPVRSLHYLLTLRRKRYDISINTHPQSRLAYRLIARIIGAPIRASHLYDHSNFLDRCLVNRHVPQDYSIHGVENNLQLLALIGKTPLLPKHDFEVFLPPEDSQWADDFIQANHLGSNPCLGIHVGSGGTKNLALKRWPLDCYIELLKKFTQTHPGIAVLLFGGPEEEQAHVRILRECPDRLIFAPQTGNLRQAAALLNHCQAFLSVDTALMHLAAAMKVPNQLVIEAPTLNPTNLPHNNPCTIIRNPDVAGRNLDYYRYDGGPIRGSDDELLRCMRSISVHEVYQALLTAFGSEDGGR